jgi:hypothetical protein
MTEANAPFSFFTANNFSSSRAGNKCLDEIILYKKTRK